MPATDKIVFNNFLSYLFATGHFDILGERSRIRPFAYCMFASLVQYLPQFIAMCGEQHVVVVNLLSAARKFGYSLSILLAWGKSVADEWALKNVLNVDKASDFGPAMVKLQQEVIALKAQNTVLSAQNSELLQRAVRADEKLDQIITLLAKQPTGLPSPGSKRARERSPVPQDVPPLPVAPLAVSTTSSSAPPPVSALALLRPPSPKFIINGEMALFDLYKVWYQRGYTVVNSAGKWEAEKRIKHLVVTAIKYTDSVMTPKLREILVTTPVPTGDDGGYVVWNAQYTKACRELVTLVADTLHNLDKKKFRNPASLNALGHRAPKL